MGINITDSRSVLPGEVLDDKRVGPFDAETSRRQGEEQLLLVLVLREQVTFVLDVLLFDLHVQIFNPA